MVADYLTPASNRVPLGFYFLLESDLVESVDSRGGHTDFAPEAVLPGRVLSQQVFYFF